MREIYVSSGDWSLRILPNSARLTEESRLLDLRAKFSGARRFRSALRPVAHFVLLGRVVHGRHYLVDDQVAHVGIGRQRKVIVPVVPAVVEVPHVVIQKLRRLTLGRNRAAAEK